MRRFIGRVLNAVGVIIGEYIEETATQVTRDSLVQQLHERDVTVRELEEELDLSAQEIMRLRSQLIRSDPPVIRWSSSQEPDQRQDRDDYMGRTCEGCGLSNSVCVCIPF